MLNVFNMRRHLNIDDILITYFITSGLQIGFQHFKIKLLKLSPIQGEKVKGIMFMQRLSKEHFFSKVYSCLLNIIHCVIILCHPHKCLLLFISKLLSSHIYYKYFQKPLLFGSDIVLKLNEICIHFHHVIKKKAFLNLATKILSDSPFF